MNNGDALSRWRKRARGVLCAFYLLAGALHLLFPAPFLSITPGWVPFPAGVIAFTGLCELAGAAGLLNDRFRRAAGVGLALYAVCVYPANIKHAMDGLFAVDASAWAWLYHLPRLAFQPVLVWLPLFASGLVTWPLARVEKT